MQNHWLCLLFIFSPPFLLKPRPKQHFVSIQFCERKDFEGEQQISSCTTFTAHTSFHYCIQQWCLQFERCRFDSRDLWFLKRWPSLYQTEDIEGFPLLFIRMLKVFTIYKCSLRRTILIGWVRNIKGHPLLNFLSYFEDVIWDIGTYFNASSNSELRGCLDFQKFQEKMRVGCYWEYQAEFLSSVLHRRT